MGREVKSATIEKTTTGRYYVSVLVEEEIDSLPETDRIAAIDLGRKGLPERQVFNL